MSIIIGVIVLFLFIILPMAVKIVAEHERAVIFRRGQLIGVKGPGVFLVIPFVDRMFKVDLQVTPTDADGYYFRGITYGALGKRAEAIADLDMCIKLSQLPSLTEAARQMIDKLQIG